MRRPSPGRHEEGIRGAAASVVFLDVSGDGGSEGGEGITPLIPRLAFAPPTRVMTDARGLMIIDGYYPRGAQFLFL